MKLQIGSKIISIVVFDKSHLGRNDKYVSKKTALRIIKEESKACHRDQTAVKIGAIKRIRELSRIVYEQGTTRIEYAMGLKEAKDFVEMLVVKYRLLRNNHPL